METIQPNTLYLLADTQFQFCTYHWSLLLTSSSPVSSYIGSLYHATTRIQHPLPNGPIDGPWRLDIKYNHNPYLSGRLVLMYKLATISEEKLGNVEGILKGVPADGQPSLRTGQSFTCLVWLGDVLVELDRKGVMELRRSIIELEVRARMTARDVEKDVLSKVREPLVLNDTGVCST